MIYLSKIGFRTSFLGFNKDDVNLYLMQLQREFSEKEHTLALKNSELENSLTSLKEKLEQTAEKLEKAEKELEYFKGKEAEIEKMSVSIGTMYLVAKQNAEQMVHTAEECAKEINEFSAHQLEATAQAEEHLKKIKEDVSASAQRFSSELAELSEDLESTKIRLSSKLEKASSVAEISVSSESKSDE